MDPTTRCAAFWKFISPEPNTGCWLWTGGLGGNAGYGSTKVRGRSTQRAHRAVYEAYVGPVPEGLELDHLCRQRTCVNPAHLEPVTHAENMRRSAPATKTHCKRGHSLAGNNLAPRKDGHRECRICLYARVKAWKARAA